MDEPNVWVHPRMDSRPQTTGPSSRSPAAASCVGEQVTGRPQRRRRNSATRQPRELTNACMIGRRAVDPGADAERELVACARNGDEAAFEALAARYSPRLQRIVVRVTQDQDSAQDALQDALIRAWKNIERFQGRSSFFTWLTRIALNEAYRTAGREEARALLPLDDAVAERIPGWGTQPDQVFESREFLAAVDAALGRLPDDYRVAVVLRDVEGLSTAEAAEVLGVEEGALKSRLHRGRMGLRRELDAFFAPN